MKGWEELDEDEQKKVLEKGYKDLRFVMLRNGGMISIDDGTRSLRNHFWKNYPYFQTTWYTMLIGILLYSVYIERHNVENVLESGHYIVMLTSLVCGNVDFLIYRKDLDKLLRYVGHEFFHYDEEEPELYKEKKEASRREVRVLVTGGLVIYILCGNFISFGQPFMYYLATKDEPTGRPDLDQYLPVPMYFPWDTNTAGGFVAAYLIQVSGSVFIVVNVIANGFSYVNLMVYFRCQLQILNHSIKNIDTRAVERYRKKYGFLPESINIKEELVLNNKLLSCFRDCLKQNIMHHQCLISFERTSRRMLRVILLFVFFNASILMASTGYLLVKNLDSKVRAIKFIQLLITEIFHTFLFCYYGEQISQESENLYANLYDMGWYKYGKEFNSLLLVMMTVTEKPLRSLTAIFNTPCSLETFNALMSTAYSYFSVINGMKDNL